MAWTLGFVSATLQFYAQRFEQLVVPWECHGGTPGMHLKVEVLLPSASKQPILEPAEYAHQVASLLLAEGADDDDDDDDDDTDDPIAAVAGGAAKGAATQQDGNHAFSSSHVRMARRIRAYVYGVQVLGSQRDGGFLELRLGPPVAPGMLAAKERRVVYAECLICNSTTTKAGPAQAYRLAKAVQGALRGEHLRWAAWATSVPQANDWAEMRDYYEMVGDINERKEPIAHHGSVFSNATIWRVDDSLRLVLNNIIMSDTRDEHIYHELLVQPALLASDFPQKVLIIGGGEGATLREVLKDRRVENATMVDIDQGLVHFCRDHLPEMHRGSFNSSRTTLAFEDGIEFVQRLHSETYDVVIVDGTDFSEVQSSDYGNALFAQAFYQELHRVLRAGGVLSQYASSAEPLASIHAAGFQASADLGVDVHSFLGSGARFAVATKDVPQNPYGLPETLVEKLQRRVLEEQEVMKWAYLSPESLRDSLEHKGRRLKGGGFGMSGFSPSPSAAAFGGYRSTGTSYHHGVMYVGRPGMHSPTYFAAWLLSTHVRRRRGYWVDDYSDGCAMDLEYISSRARGAAITADGGSAALPDTAASNASGATPVGFEAADGVATTSTSWAPLPESDKHEKPINASLPAVDGLCTRTIGCMTQCSACDQCADEACMNSIVGCDQFISQLYYQCEAPEEQSAAPFLGIFLLVATCVGVGLFAFCAMVLTPAKPTAYAQGTDEYDEEFRSNQSARESMIPHNGVNLVGEMHLNGTYADDDTPSQETACHYQLIFDASGKFTGTGTSVEGSIGVFGLLSWFEDQTQGLIAWRENDADEDVEARGHIMLNNDGSYVIDVHFATWIKKERSFSHGFIKLASESVQDLRSPHRVDNLDREPLLGN